MYFAYLETDRAAKRLHDANMKAAAAERRSKRAQRSKPQKKDSEMDRRPTH